MFTRGSFGVTPVPSSMLSRKKPSSALVSNLSVSALLSTVWLFASRTNPSVTAGSQWSIPPRKCCRKKKRYPRLLTKAPVAKSDSRLPRHTAWKPLHTCESRRCPPSLAKLGGSRLLVHESDVHHTTRERVGGLSLWHQAAAQHFFEAGLVPNGDEADVFCAGVFQADP